MLNRFLFVFGFLLCQLTTEAQPVFKTPAARLWADSVLKTMTYEEKIGQLFMVDAYSNRDSAHVNFILNLIEKYHIGGLIFFQGGPVRQSLLTNQYQQCAKIPLMIGIDGEWGLSMRLDSTIRFPRQMTLGATGNDSAAYWMGNEIGRECKRIGIHINFAPVVDINNNPLNPVINSRSFGEDKQQVARMGLMYMNGMQSEHVLACAKHFPGHGNADSDSHFTLPVITQNSAEIDSVELYPFKALINQHVASVMVAHLFIPALDSAAVPSTLSHHITTDLLQHQLGFEGLVFTDALNMKGFLLNNLPGQSEVLALKAGNDVLLYSENIPRAVEAIHHAIQECELKQNDIDNKVHKILMAKYFAGLNNFQWVDINNLYNDLHTDNAAWINYRMYEQSVTTLINKNNLLPLQLKKNESIASLVINDSTNNLFQQTLQQYARVDCYSMDNDANDFVVDTLFNLLKKYDHVIVSIHNLSTNAGRNFNIHTGMFNMVQKLSQIKESICCVFGNSYVLGKFTRLGDYDALTISYEDTYLPQYLTAQSLFGVIQTQGHLPVSPSTDFKQGRGEQVAIINRLKFTLPEEVNANHAALNKIDSIVQQAIKDTIFPGCQVLAAKDGKVFYNHSFGFHTYQDSVPVKNTDLYDIASVSKIAGTALATMLLYDKHKIDLHAKISKYLPELKKSNKKDIVLIDMLAHQAGLKAWIPFFKNTVVNGIVNDSLYHKIKDSLYTLQVADSLWLRCDYADTIWKTIIQSPLENPGKYVYSDLGMIIMQHIIEKITGTKLDEYVEENFYKPLGLSRTLYHPLSKFDKASIIPTENDTVFRHQLVHGYVHDPAAAMLGGVAGNAGVFSNAQGLAVIMQMLLNGGEYGGKRLLKKETVDLFTSTAIPNTENRRGIIFDKPEPDASKNGPTAKDASSKTFGHTGFTGTCAWVDPQNNLLYIFLSNRVYPSAENNKLAKANIRTNIMQVFYDALK